MFGNIFEESSPGYGPFNAQGSVRDEKGKEISLPPCLRYVGLTTFSKTNYI